MPTKSLYPHLDIPATDIWGYLFERKEREYPDDKGILRPEPARISTNRYLVLFVDIDTARSYTFAQLKTVAIAFGYGLKSAWEWKKGDVLALFTPNSIDTPAVVWGCHWAGGIVTTANPGTIVKNDLQSIL